MKRDEQEQEPQVGLDVFAFVSAAHAADAAVSVSLDDSRIRSLISLHESRIALAELLDYAIDPDGVRGLNVISLVNASHYANSLARESAEQIERLQRLLSDGEVDA